MHHSRSAFGRPLPLPKVERRTKSGGALTALTRPLEPFTGRVARRRAADGAAPELPGAMALGETLQARGITASIAHSDADYHTCARALGHGYRDITHIYSGCSMLHRENGFRFGGGVEAGLLEDAFTVQVIADGCHLPPELLRLILKCKGADRISLITDALFAAGSDLPDGTVLRQANRMETILEDGVMKLPDRQAFAGSVATMDRLVRNMVQLAGAPLWDTVAMDTAPRPRSRLGGA